MNTKKILIVASLALASIAAGYGLIGIRAAGGGSASDTGSGPVMGVDDGAPRVVYLDETASYPGGDDDRWGDDRDDDRDHEQREHEDDEDDEHEERDHDDD